MHSVLASLAWVIWYTDTGTNNPSNSFQVSTSKLKSKRDKFTVSGLGLVYKSTVLKHYQYRSLHLNCFTNLCHVWTENVPLVHLNVKFRHLVPVSILIHTKHVAVTTFSHERDRKILVCYT